MFDCCVLETYDGNKIFYEYIKLKIPDITVERILVPESKIKNVITKRKIKKICKNYKAVIGEGRLTKFTKISTLYILKFNLKFVLEKIISIYGLNIDTLQVGVICYNFNEDIFGILEDISKIARFINFHNEVSLDVKEEIFMRTGVYVSTLKSLEEEKILINLENFVTVEINDKIYYDVKFDYGDMDLNINYTTYDKILREFGNVEDYNKLNKGGNVKKMVLVSK